jgi:hypothetical protein
MTHLHSNLMELNQPQQILVMVNPSQILKILWRNPSRLWLQLSNPLM